MTMVVVLWEVVSTLALVVTSNIKNMKSIIRGIIICCLLIFNTQALVGANAPTNNIETLSISVSFVGKSPNEAVQNRIRDSVRVVAEQLLIGRPQAKINDDKISYQNIFFDIADRVFTGYQVQQTTINVGQNTEIVISMRPWGELLAEPGIKYEFTDIHPLFQPILSKRLMTLNMELQHIFEDMPQESVYWLNSLAKDSTSSFSSEHMPNFRLLTQGYLVKDKHIELVVIPVGKKIKSVDTKLVSKNIPQSLLLWTKDYVSELSNSLRGLPVEFVLHNQDAIKAILLDEVNKYPAVKKYNLITALQLKVDEESQVTVTADLANYNFWLKANLDLGKTENNFSGVAHIGYDITKSTEVFTEATLYTDTMNWDVDLGLSKRIVNTTFSYARRFGSTDDLLRIEHVFTPKWTARAEYRARSSYSELGIRYRFHDFVSAEYIFSSKRSWLRIITNL